jgi:hypothetical protein
MRQTQTAGTEKAFAQTGSFVLRLTATSTKGFKCTYQHFCVLKCFPCQAVTKKGIAVVVEGATAIWGYAEIPILEDVKLSS